MVELEEQKLGSPWSVLPIKNNKYAKDLVEVHLSDRALTDLEKFDNFPNLEVIWLNNNNVSAARANADSYGTWTAFAPTSVPSRYTARIINFRTLTASENSNSSMYFSSVTTN